MRLLWLCLALAAPYCCGCGGDGSAPAVTDESPVTAAPLEIERQSLSNPEPAVGTTLRTADAAPLSTSEPSHDSIRAEEALARLMTRGISVEEWEAAHQELIELGAAAGEPLREALQSSDAVAREWAASILALNAEAAAAAKAELGECLRDSSGYLRANAAAALALVPGEESRVLPVLLELTRSPDVELRRMAAVNLGNLGDVVAEHLDDLQPLLADDDPEVVQPIVELLGRLGPAAMPALPKLQQIAFEQVDGDLKSAAEQAVQRIQPVAGPALSTD